MNGFENYEEMFAQSIGIKEPWKIESAEFEEKSREVHIYVSCRKTAKYPCPKCGKMCNRYIYLTVGKLRLDCPELFV